MALVSITKVTKELGGDALFSDVTFSIFDRDRLALIGPNGSGKSTLLKMICGELECDGGKITSVTGTRVLYVPQNAEFDLNLTLEETLRRASGVDKSMPLPGEALRLSGQAGFTDLSVQVSTISGGWLKRLSLVCALSQSAEVYLLDEPTNHLDVEGVWWLEDIIASHSAAFVICSHDRYFLQKVASRTLEVNSIFEGGTFSTDGNYGQFIERRRAYIESEAKRQARLKNIVRRESEWASRQPKARGTKARARLGAARNLASELSELKGRLTTQESNIEFSGAGKRSRRLIEVEKISKAFDGNEIFSDASFVITPGSVIGLLGTNGSGKSTILKLLASMLEPDRGRVKVVQELVVGYFDQSRSTLDGSETLRRVFAPESDAVMYGGNEVHVLSWAQRFGFDYDELDKPLSKFSGGEKARAFIGYLMLQEADVLLLDEPTNDLDIETLELLENAVSSSDKAFVIVSHDRYFLEQVCTDFYAITEEKKLQRFGGIAQWEREKKGVTARESAGIKSSAESTNSDGSNQAGKLSYDEQREYRSIEAKIEKREAKVAKLEAKMLTDEIASEPDKLLEISEELVRVNKEVETLYTRWEELERKRS